MNDTCKDIIAHEAIIEARKYRASKTDPKDACMRTEGYVRIYENRPYGWGRYLGRPENEKIGAIAVGADESVHQAVGSNGVATAWRQLLPSR